MRALRCRVRKETLFPKSTNRETPHPSMTRDFHSLIKPMRTAVNLLLVMCLTISQLLKNIKTLVEAMPVNNIKGRKNSMDRLYTSVSIGKWLMSRNKTLVCTLQSKRIGLPDKLKNPKERSEFESTIHWEKQHDNIALCTYTTKTKSKEMKNIFVMSTMQPLLGITKDDDKQKPAVIKFYDFTKGGIDVMDMKTSKFSCKTLSHRWAMVHFYYLLDTIRCNALSLLAIKHDKSLKKKSTHLTLALSW